MHRGIGSSDTVAPLFRPRNDEEDGHLLDEEDPVHGEFQIAIKNLASEVTLCNIVTAHCPTSSF
jgi:hypothetical protein